MPVLYFNSDLKLDSWDSSACSLKCSCRTLASDIIEEHFAGFAVCWHALTVGTHNSKTQRCNTSFLHFKSLHEVQFCTDSVDYINFEWKNKSDYVFISLAFIIFKAASYNYFKWVIHLLYILNYLQLFWLFLGFYFYSNSCTLNTGVEGISQFAFCSSACLCALESKYLSTLVNELWCRSIWWAAFTFCF